MLLGSAIHFLGLLSTEFTIAGFIPGVSTSAAVASIGVESYKIQLQNIEEDPAISLANDIRSEIKAAKKLRLPRWGVLCGMIGSFLCAWLLDNFGKLDGSQ